MQISFPAHVVQDRIVDIPESDMEALRNAMRDCFLTHLEFSDCKSSYLNHEKFVVETCKKYNVDVKNVADRLAFFKALLGLTADFDPNSCNG
jgi:hypothetical protein